MDQMHNPEFVHCYDFGCKSTKAINYSTKQWQQIHDIFARPALSPWLEKQKIRHAIAKMESFSGTLAGTSVDKAGNYNEKHPFNQLDCIDESTNTMQYLYALQDKGYLNWHNVIGKHRRIRFILTHWTAVIEQKDNGEKYAVDSWYRDNGEPPYVQRLTEWQSRTRFPTELNP